MIRVYETFIGSGLNKLVKEVKLDSDGHREGDLTKQENNVRKLIYEGIISPEEAGDLIFIRQPGKLHAKGAVTIDFTLNKSKSKMDEDAEDECADKYPRTNRRKPIIITGAAVPQFMSFDDQPLPSQPTIILNSEI